MRYATRKGNKGKKIRGKIRNGGKRYTNNFIAGFEKVSDICGKSVAFITKKRGKCEVLNELYSTISSL